MRPGLSRSKSLFGCFAKELHDLQTVELAGVKGREKGEHSGPAVFTWSEIQIWEAEIRELLADVLSPSVFDAFRERPPEFVVGDDLSWLNRIVSRVQGDWEGRRTFVSGAAISGPV